MANQYPHTVTARKLLAFTENQYTAKELKAKLKRHELAVQKLKAAGYDYDPETGVIWRGQRP